MLLLFVSEAAGAGLVIIRINISPPYKRLLLIATLATPKPCKHSSHTYFLALIQSATYFRHVRIHPIHTSLSLQD